MSNMTYAELVAKLQAWEEDDDLEFQTSIDDIINLGEMRLWRDLDLGIFTSEDTTPTVQSNELLLKPVTDTELVSFQSLWYDNAGLRTFLQLRSPDWIRDYQDPAAEAAPRYYCELEQDNWAAAIRRNFFGIEPTLVDFDSVWREERIIKATLPVRSTEEKAKAELFRLHFGSRLNLSWTGTPAYPDEHFINVINPAASKGKALEELASFLGIPLSETAAIGDGLHDISLLSRAGLAIAMASAPDELKTLADYVVPDVENNGVAAAIEKFVL